MQHASSLTYAPRDEKWGRLVAFWFTSFQSVGFSLSLVMIPANVGGLTKRQVTTVVTFVDSFQISHSPSPFNSIRLGTLRR
ncbi:hypothetical protein DFH06DRAFT_443742 [Mycena polygramma]|nr:hypothetical protein DFH06DRAFT_443742 [Mycena polygramma]